MPPDDEQDRPSAADQSPERAPDWYVAAEAAERAAEAEHEGTQDRQQDLLGQGAYALARYLSRQDGGWTDPDLQDARRVIAALTPDKRFNFDDLDPGGAPPSPPPPGAVTPFFGVWNGTVLNGNLADIFRRVKALTPPGDWRREWYPKAGEGGSWQSQFGDANGLSNEVELTDWVAAGLAEGILVAPYVVIRGKPAWNEGEWEQIAACAVAADKVILNLEPNGGSRYYWNGPTTPEYIQSYCDGMHAAIRRRGAEGADISLCYIPRRTQVNELGGDAALKTWLRNVSMASGECYEDAPAPSLAPGYAIPNVMEPLADGDPRKCIPTVQRSMIGRYADSQWTRLGMEVWHLDGNI